MKVHEISLMSTKFNDFIAQKYVIIDNTIYSVQEGDYILYKEIERDEDGNTTETGKHRMIRVDKIIKDEGLKDNYILIIYSTLS